MRTALYNLEDYFDGVASVRNSRPMRRIALFASFMCAVLGDALKRV